MMLVGSKLGMEDIPEYVIHCDDCRVFKSVNFVTCGHIYFPKLKVDGFIYSGNRQTMRMVKINFGLVELL